MRRHEGLAVAERAVGAGNGTADRAIRILQLFTPERPVWTVSQLASRLGMPRSTTYRYLASLRSCTLVVEDGDRGFRLGPGVFSLARAAKASTSVVRLAAPYLWELADRYGARVGFQERVGSDLVPLDILEGPAVMSVGLLRSQLLPWPTTCAAMVLLAFAPDDERQELLGRMKPTQYTCRTVRDKETLIKVLADTRRLGYAISDEDSEEGAWGVAAPVFSYGEARYAMGVAVPKPRLRQMATAPIVAAVELAGSRLSTDLAKTEI